MNETKPIIVIGAGGHAKVVVSTLLDSGVCMVSLFDDDIRKYDKKLLGIPVKGSIDKALINPDQSLFILGIGDNKTRLALARRFEGVAWFSAIHPGAFVHPSSKIGKGAVIFAGAIVQPDSVIGDHCIINSGALVDHECTIEHYAHIGPGANLAGGVKVGSGAFLGIGCSVTPGVSIGSWATIGAGSVVISDIPPNAIAVGAPAKVIKYSSPPNE